LNIPKTKGKKHQPENSVDKFSNETLEEKRAKIKRLLVDIGEYYLDCKDAMNMSAMPLNPVSQDEDSIDCFTKNTAPPQN
jgi:hypothetical protein